MTAAAIQFLWSHWRRHKLQLITLLTGIALATGLWSAVQAINAEARASYARASGQLALGQFDALQAPSGFIPVSQYVALRRAGWQLAAVLEGSLLVNDQSVRLMGVDMVSYPAVPAVTQAEQGDDPIEPADILTAPGRLLVSNDVAHLFDDTPSFPPAFASASLPPGFVLTDIGVAEQLLDRQGQISRLMILADQPAGLTPLSDLAPNLQRVPASDQLDTAQLTDSFHLNLSAFGLLSFAVGLFIVHGTVGLAFAQRRGMIRTLRALGMPMRRLITLLLSELVFLACIGGLLGLTLGFFLAGALLPDVSATLRGLYGAPVDGQLSLRPQWAAAGLFMALGGTLVASSQALLRLSRLPLLQGPGLRAWRGTESGRHLSAGIGLALGAVGLTLYATIGGLIGGFALLAGLLTGSALLLPLLLSRVLNTCAGTAKGPVAQWIWADMQAQLPGLNLALMALLLALAANIGVGTMVSSFRLTFIGWLDQRLTSELYVTAQDEDQMRDLTTWLAPQVDAILPIRRTELSHETGPLFLYGIVDHDTYRDHWPLIAKSSNVWSDVMQNGAVLINEQLARRADLWPGQVLELAPDRVLEIAGVYSDYGNPTGQAIVAMPLFDDIAPDVGTRRFGIRMDPAQTAAMTQALRDRFDLPPSGVIRQDAMKAQSIAIFENTFVVTSALNVLTLGVAGFAILTSLLTLWTQRLPQIAPVWALGMTRARLAWLELLRSVLLAALTACLALPLGLSLAWVLLAVVNVEAFGWQLPMYLFPGAWAGLFALTILAAALAAALPALRLRKVPPADLLRVFANER